MTTSVRYTRRCDTCAAPVAHWHSVDGYRIYENRACGHRMVLRDDVAEAVEELYRDEYFTQGGQGTPTTFPADGRSVPGPNDT